VPSIASTRRDRLSERRGLHELMVAGATLREETEHLHQWLIRADEYLTKNPDHKDFHAREERYLSELKRYADSHNLLGKALMAIGKEE
jgi:hypothetical protein